MCESVRTDDTDAIESVSRCQSAFLKTLCERVREEGTRRAQTAAKKSAPNSRALA